MLRVEFRQRSQSSGGYAAADRMRLDVAEPLFLFRAGAFLLKTAQGRNDQIEADIEAVG